MGILAATGTGFALFIRNYRQARGSDSRPMITQSAKEDHDLFIKLVDDQASMLKAMSALGSSVSAIEKTDTDLKERIEALTISVQLTTEMQQRHLEAGGEFQKRLDQLIIKVGDVNQANAVILEHLRFPSGDA